MDKLFGAAILADDSVVVTGYTEGTLATTNAGGSDFYAARIDSDGALIWQWQVMTPHSPEKNGTHFRRVVFRLDWRVVNEQRVFTFRKIASTDV